MSWLENVQMLGEPALPASENIICLDSNGAIVWNVWTSFSLGDIMNSATPTIPFVFECLVPGVSGTSEAPFEAVTAAGQIVVDDTVTWISRDPFIWNHPMITAERAMNAYKANLPAAKEIWMEKNHQEAPASNINIYADSELFDEIPAIYRVDKATNTYSPARTDGSSNLNFLAGGPYDASIATDAYWYGISLQCGDTFQLHEYNHRFEDSVINFGTGMYFKSAHAELLNTEIIGNTSAATFIGFFQSAHAKISFLGCSFDFDSHVDGWLQGANVISYQDVEFIDCDMSNMTNPGLVDSSDFSLGSDTFADVTRLELSFSNCYLPSSYTIWDGAWVADKATNITVENCSDDGTNTYVNEYKDVTGSLKYDDAAYFDSGYEDDESATRFSIVLSPEDKVSQSFAIASSQIGGFFADRGVKIVTLELVENFTNPLNASEIWLELYYYKNNGDAIRTLDKSTKEYVKATFTELPAGTGLGNWTGEPGGSRSVKLTASLSVNHPGLFYGVVKLAKYESGKVVHIDPEFQIS